jgi:HEAT repeat protein
LRKDAENTLKASLSYLEKSGDTILSREPSAKPYESRPLEVWLEDLRHGTPGRRVAALWAIQSHSHLISGGEQVSLIAGNLSHHDPFVRSAAAQALDTLGESASQSIPALLTTLEDRNGSVRMTAAFALGKMTGHAEDIIPNLSSLLNDRNVHVANAAAWSLGQFGLQAEEAGPVIVRLLRRGILHCEESTLDDILDALLAVSNQPEEVIMETVLERDAETCRRALDLLKERQIDVKDGQPKAESGQPE